MGQIRGASQPQHRRIVAPERALQRAAMIVECPLIHGAALPMIGKQPESDFELGSRKSGHLDMDRVVVLSLVPRFDFVQDLARKVRCLPGFVYLGARRWGHYAGAGLCSDHRVADQTARHEPGIDFATCARLRARRQKYVRSAHGRPLD